MSNKSAPYAASNNGYEPVSALPLIHAKIGNDDNDETLRRGVQSPYDMVENQEKNEQNDIDSDKNRPKEICWWDPPDRVPVPCGRRPLAKQEGTDFLIP